MHAAFLPKSASATPVDLVTIKAFGAWLKAQDARTGALAEAAAFAGEAGRVLLVTDASGRLVRAAAGISETFDPMTIAALPAALPPGDYALASVPKGTDPGAVALAWADGLYRFTRYKTSNDKPRRLVMQIGRAHV